MSTTTPPSKPPTPRLPSMNLPDVEVEVNEDTDMSQLSNSQLHQLNQSLLDETADVTRPLVDDVASIAELRAEYENGSPSFVHQIDWLRDHGFLHIRRTRGDGDCFYRSVAFAYIERLIYAPDQDIAVASALSLLSSSLQMLELSGFQAMVYEDFYDVFVELIQQVVKPGAKLDSTVLLTCFQAPEISNSIVMYLRLLTSAQIRQDPDAFQDFLFHPELGEPMTVRQFCESFVEAVGREADHVQMTALSRALQIDIDVAYLDGRGNKEGAVEFVQLHNSKSGSNTKSPVVLLYRPGHYDILIPPRQEQM